MSDHSLQFRLPPALSTARLAACLCERFGFEATGPERLDQTFFDTFDHRLEQRGGIVEVTREREGRHLAWRDLAGDGLLASARVDDAPRFARDLPDSPLRSRLEPIIEMRALLPQATLTLGRRQLALRDAEGKTVLRLTLERYELPVDGKTRRLARRLRLLPVKGYEDRLVPVETYLHEEWQLVTADETVYTEARRLGGTASNDPSPGSPRLVLDPAQRMDEAAKQMLRAWLPGMLDNEAGLRQRIDTEFLHDFRVAGRRSRSVLTQVKHIFPQQTTQRFAREFAWLNRVSGPARDMDVYLLHLPDYRARLPGGLREALDPLQALLERHRDHHYRALDRALGSARYRRFLRDWQAFLEAPVPGRSRLPNALRPVRTVAAERIDKAYHKTIKQGRAIDADSPDEALHTLRKSCKKLRYLLEMFQSLAPGAAGKLIKKLKRLQDNLGEFHDLEVQIAALGGFLEEMQGAGNVETNTQQAVDRLVSDLEQRQRIVRDDFARQFDKFARPATRRLVAAVSAGSPETAPS